MQIQTIYDPFIGYTTNQRNWSSAQRNRQTAKKRIKGIESLNTNIVGIGNNSNGFYTEDIFYLAKTKKLK